MKIKKYFYTGLALLALILTEAKFASAQNVGISSSSSFTPDASAALDISFTNKGLLAPRVALTANNVPGPISSPATSLLVYNTATAGTSPNNVIPGYYYWNGSVWMMLNTNAQTNSQAWALGGNSGTTSTGTSGTLNFLGTTDNVPFRMRTNNVQRLMLDTLGSVAIGLNPVFATNREKLLVDAGTTSSYNVISGKGNINNYLQLNIQNTNAGSSASSDVVATADNGSESTYYVDLGINSSVNTANLYGGANDSYLYSTGNTSSTGGGNFYIGTNTAGKSLGFLTGGGTIGTPASGSTAAAANNERLHIDGSTGYVGLNNPSPSQVLDVTGNMRFSGALMPNNNAGLAGNFLISTGASNAPVWFNANSYAWLTGGNSGTTAGTNFIGTTDAKDFVVKTNNAEAARFASGGNFGIGTNSPSTKLHVFGANPLTLSGVVTGTNTTADSLLTITSGLVRKLPLSSFATSSNSWATTGNTGTTAGTNFIGTIDSVDFVAKTKNLERLRVSAIGDVSIGGTAFNSTNPEQLLVDAGTTSSYNVISGKGNLNSYLQLNIQNNNNGTAASSDVVASNSTATESTNYIDMGINAAGNTSTGLLGGASTAYLLATGNDFAIGNGAQNKNLLFFTSGTTSPANNTERMRITPGGNVGIGTTSPSQLLDVAGGINASGSIYLDAANSNTGALSPGLYFGGSGSGETISSKRTSGTNQYGIDFYTSGNLRMSVVNGGNVGIGINTPGYKLTVAGIVAPSVDGNYSLGSSSYRWSAVYSQNGTLQTSDRRLKTNIKHLNYGLKEVLALQPVSYNWIDNSHPENKIGLIAQDVKKLVPEVVTGNEAKEKLGMNYAELVPVLINAIKEQQKQINELKKQVQKLQK